MNEMKPTIDTLLAVAALALSTVVAWGNFAQASENDQKQFRRIVEQRLCSLEVTIYKHQCATG